MTAGRAGKKGLPEYSTGTVLYRYTPRATVFLRIPVVYYTGTSIEIRLVPPVDCILTQPVAVWLAIGSLGWAPSLEALHRAEGAGQEGAGQEGVGEEGAGRVWSGGRGLG